MEEIIKKAIDGDKESFTILILNCQQDLYKIALSKLNSEYDIDEAIQETMILAFRNLKRLKEPSNFKKWIIKILINKCNEVYRKRKFNFVSLSDYEQSQLDTNFIFQTDSKLNFYELLSCLNSKERLIMILYYAEKYTTKEIASILNKKENTVKSIMRRAKIKLKEQYKELEEN